MTVSWLQKQPPRSVLENNVLNIYRKKGKYQSHTWFSQRTIFGNVTHSPERNISENTIHERFPWSFWCCFRQHFSKTNEASNFFQVPLETCTEFNPYLPIFTLNKVHGLYLSSFLFVNLPIKKNIISAAVTVNCWCRRYYLIMHTYTCYNIAGRL